MAYLVTMLQPSGDGAGEGRSSSFEVASEVEAVRIAQEGSMIAGRRGKHVTYEVHDQDGRLLLSFTSAAKES